ncbi:MAG TPA: hut operon positive regulator HutP [Firmicutes bacterium]|nr:hut operon positive regulator HutP [Bacillota bacterium]
MQGSDSYHGNEHEKARPSAAAARAAVQIAMSTSRDQERDMKRAFLDAGIRAAAVDIGGPFIQSIARTVENVLVAAKREGVIQSSHPHEGAVTGAAREALAQLMPRAAGFNVGGKVGVARCGEHLSVAVFLEIGLLHLDDVGLAVAHRAVPAADAG